MGIGANPNFSRFAIVASYISEMDGPVPNWHQIPANPTGGLKGMAF
jgi:hypothetical protein